MLAIMMPERVCASNVVGCAVNGPVTELARGTMNAEVGVGNAVTGDVVSRSLESPHEHAPAKIGEDLENGGEESVKLGVGQCGYSAGSGGVRASHCTIRLRRVGINRVARLRKPCPQRTPPDGAGRAVQDAGKMGGTTKPEGLSEELRIDLDTRASTCGNAAGHDEGGAVWCV